MSELKIDDTRIRSRKGFILITQDADLIILNIDQARTLSAFIEEQA